MNSVEHFEVNKFVKIRGLLEDPFLSVAYLYSLRIAQAGAGVLSDVQVPETPSFYRDHLMEVLLEVSKPMVEEIIGLELLSTYSYMRVYKTGDTLKPHVDREACEISMSLCLGSAACEDQSEEPAWPIFVRPPGLDEGIPVSLEPGDAVVYRGREVTHWREAFQGDHQAQVFLHYVDAKGPFAKRAGDRHGDI